ncbi:ABC transporter substrate-binding protein [Pseudalkalibacillus decolorationis]|uniref:ABC transporter substrate-binding protein n=1 Tax=Pseudalkalibacillus decolorationis TaxID=163879 RepID=UPI00214878DE|nr:ABC transporter substrate-binding protein [Pseudalkalibacillus decolorationis]
MKKYWGILIGLLVLLLITACSNNTNPTQTSKELMKKDWSEIEKDVKGTKVRIYMWGGDEGINQYMDEWVAPRLKKQFGITLERVPMDAPEFLKKLMNEKKANHTEGNMDIIWINGENFKNAKENDLLFGPFANQLPNVKKYVDTEALDVKYDFGTKVDGMEAPWGKVQFVYQYDQAKVPNPPKTFAELKKWIKENPGKFTYPDPTDFTGNAFLRQIFYESVGDVQTILDKGYDEQFAAENSKKMWEYLNEIEPYLWRQGKTYPNDLTELDRLYSQGEVYMTMGYNEARAESFIDKGIFPETTKTFVLESGSIGNTHFLAIPFNSPNKEGALTAINFLLSPDAQLTKLEPTYWGENMSLDPKALSEKDQARLNSIHRGDSVLPAETLKQYLQPEVNAQYVTWLKENWINEVVQEK